MLCLNGCGARYGPFEVFSGLALSVERSRTAAIIGQSGCGKSTLLRLAAGLLPGAEGEVSLDGTSVTGGDQRVGLVLQSYGLFPWMTVNANVAVGVRIRGEPAAQVRQKVDLALARTGLVGLGEAYPVELSGGQQQRVALARTLAVDPGLLLLDEPFSAVDALTREYLQDLLRGILGARPIVTVLVTHDTAEAAYLGDAVYSMSLPPRCRLHRFAGSGLPEGSREGYRNSWEYAQRCREVRLFLEERRGG
jgi:NitT/TauT family transport system ATP-binding protein